jgi:putative ABC transport system permease protein
MLQVKNICRQYQTGTFIQKALDDVSLNLRDSEFVAILGPSGSGKTTLLNIIGGLDRYDSGDLIIDGISTKNYHERDWDSYRNHTVGFIFQSYNLIPHQTLLENVELALTLSGVTGEERRKRAEDALAAVGLKEQAHKLPSQLSGGQMQRVSIARALVNNPRIVLADEPTGALDSDTSIQVMDLLKEVARDRLVVMVTHNPDLAQRYATRIVRLKDGRITADSDPFDVPAEEKKPVHRNLGRTSMPFRTALQLSFNNLKSKFTRTLLVAFAGSIGIIGIGLVDSISSGVKKYIKDTEEETLSQYPLEIDRDSFSMASLMMSSQVSTTYGLAGIEEDAEDDGLIHEVQLLGQLLSQVDANDLGALKAYFESGETNIDEYAHSIEYLYDITPNLYLQTRTGWKMVNPDKAFASLGIGVSNSAVMSNNANVNIFYPLPASDELYQDQYELLAGHYPENSHECLLVLTSQGKISDFMLYTMGLKDPDELSGYIEAFANNEEFEVRESDTEYTYDQLLAVKFRLVHACDTYTYDESLGVYSSRADDEEFMKKSSAWARTLRSAAFSRAPIPKASVCSRRASTTPPASLMKSAPMPRAAPWCRPSSPTPKPTC